MKWLLVFLLSFAAIAQHDTEGREKIMKMRAEMHRRMMEKLINGMGDEDALFKDMEQCLEIDELWRVVLV